MEVSGLCLNFSQKCLPCFISCSSPAAFSCSCSFLSALLGGPALGAFGVSCKIFFRPLHLCTAYICCTKCSIGKVEKTLFLIHYKAALLSKIKTKQSNGFTNGINFFPQPMQFIFPFPVAVLIALIGARAWYETRLQDTENERSSNEWVNWTEKRERERESKRIKKVCVCVWYGWGCACDWKKSSLKAPVPGKAHVYS